MSHYGVATNPCYCQACIKTLRSQGKDPRDEKAVIELAEQVYLDYADKVNELINKIKPGCSVFHNAEHVPQGRKDIIYTNSHLELESLPTGGWGMIIFNCMQNIGKY